ncbi:hypothetical protein [Nocardiopsis sp. NPDC055824]
MPPVDVTRPEPDPRNQQPLDNDFTVLIVPEAIPVPGTSVEVLQTAAANLRAAAEEVAEGGAGVESSWQALQAHYTAPESETLLAAMGPVARKGDTVLEDVSAVVTALETFAEEAESARTRLRNIRDDAVAFVEEVRDEEFWALNPWHYGKNRSLKLWANIVWATFQEAERECATAISAVNGQGNTYTAVGGEAPGPREVAYGLDPDEVPDIAFDLTESSEWQRAGEEGWAHLTGSDKPWPLDWAADAFAAQQEHFGVGMAWGLGVGALSSIGLWRAGSGWAGSVGEAVDNAVTHKEETFQGYGALVGMYGEDGWMNPFDSEEGSGRTWRENAGAAWTEVGHDLFPWREWEDRPAYTLSTAGGNLALTVVAFPVRGGMLLSRIGGGGPDLPDIDVLERPGVAWEPGAAARPGFSLAQTLSGIRTGFSDTASGIGLRLDQLRTGVLARFAHWEVVEGAPEPGGSGGPGAESVPGTGPLPAPVHAGDGGVPDGRSGAPAAAVPAGRGDDVGVAELVADVERYSGMDADARPAWLLAREEVPVGAGARGGGMEVPGGDGTGDRTDHDFRVTAAHDPDPKPATPASTPRDGSADIRAVPLHGDPAGASGPGSDGPARPGSGLPLTLPADGASGSDGRGASSEDGENGSGARPVADNRAPGPTTLQGLESHSWGDKNDPANRLAFRQDLQRLINSDHEIYKEYYKEKNGHRRSVQTTIGPEKYPLPKITWDASTHQWVCLDVPKQATYVGDRVMMRVHDPDFIPEVHDGLSYEERTRREELRGEIGAEELQRREWIRGEFSMLDDLATGRRESITASQKAQVHLEAMQRTHGSYLRGGDNHVDLENAKASQKLADAVRTEVAERFGEESARVAARHQFDGRPVLRSDGTPLMRDVLDADGNPVEDNGQVRREEVRPNLEGATYIEPAENAPGNGNDQFDQIYRTVDGDIVIIEAKADVGTDLGGRIARPQGRPPQEVQQGTREYLLDILRVMEERALILQEERGLDDESALRELELVEEIIEKLDQGKVVYAVFKGNAEPAGAGGGGGPLEVANGYNYQVFDVFGGS